MFLQHLEYENDSFMNTKQNACIHYFVTNSIALFGKQQNGDIGRPVADTQVGVACVFPDRT